MNILILHQHFKLPSQAGSTRLYSFVKKISEKNRVFIVTGQSCRKNLSPLGYHAKKKSSLFQEIEIDKNILVISIPDLYDQTLPFLGRVSSFILFAVLSSFFSLKVSSPSIVFASSTPLTIAIPALFVSKIRKIPFIFEVRDLWPEAPIQLGILKNRILIFFARMLEKTAYKNANEIIGISTGICSKIERMTQKKVHFIPHGVDDLFLKQNLIKEIKGKDKSISVIYAGSCGYNNAIEIFFKVAERVLIDNDLRSMVEFKLIGDGPALKELRGNTPVNINLLGKLPKTEVVSHLCKADIALFSQRKVTKGDFKKDSLPNKFFDFIGASLPIIAGVQEGGEMEKYIKENKCGISVSPEDDIALYNALQKIILDSALREEMSMASKKLSEKFERPKQSDYFCRLLEKTAHINL